MSRTNLTSGSFAAGVRTDSTTAVPGKIAKHCARRTAHHPTWSDTNGESRGNGTLRRETHEVVLEISDHRGHEGINITVSVMSSQTQQLRKYKIPLHACSFS